MVRQAGREADGLEQSLLAVRSVGFLRGLRPELVDEVLESASVVHLSPDGVNVPASTSIVVSGLLGYFLWYPDGRQITIRYVAAGDLIGAVSASASTVATGVRAIEQSALLQLSTARLRTLAGRDLELSSALIEEMSTRLRSAYRTLAMRSFGSVKVRVARDIVARMRAAGHLTPGVQVRVTRQALADATGSVREVVARALRELARQGIVETGRARVTILDVDGLLREARLSGPAS